MRLPVRPKSPGCECGRHHEPVHVHGMPTQEAGTVISANRPARRWHRVAADQFLHLAQQKIDQRKLQEAATLFLQALEGNPLLHQAHGGLGAVYALASDPVSAFLEYAAHTEIAPNSKAYLERMTDYVLAKFSRSPSAKNRRNPSIQAHAFFDLSRAIWAYHQGDYHKSHAFLKQVLKEPEQSGIADFLLGHVQLRLERLDASLQAFAKAARHNGYFARLLLEQRTDDQLASLTDQLALVLEQELKKHPADVQSALVLSAIHLRHRDPRKALGVIQDALSWSRPRWDLLYLRSVAYHQLGQKDQRDQALDQIRSQQLDLSFAFSGPTPSLFHGLLRDTSVSFAQSKLAQVFDEPKRSYFRWRLLAEVGNAEALEYKKQFLSQMNQFFSATEFEDANGSDAPDQGQPKNRKEYLGAVQTQIDQSMTGLWRCDRSRRDRRINPTGRFVLQIRIADDGRIANIGLLENTTEDDVLAYCAIRKLLNLHFPRPFRSAEVFRLPVVVGPQGDGWMSQ